MKVGLCQVRLGVNSGCTLHPRRFHGDVTRCNGDRRSLMPIKCDFGSQKEKFCLFCTHSCLSFDFYQQILVQNYHNYKYLYYLCTDFQIIGMNKGNSSRATFKSVCCIGCRRRSIGKVERTIPLALSRTACLSSTAR